MVDSYRLFSYERKTMKNWQKTAVMCMFAVGVSSYGFSGEEQIIVRAPDQVSFKGSSDFFVGNSRVEMAFSATKGIPAAGGFVTFEPGARSNWHYHPTGQQIIVISGVGLTGTRDGKVEEFRAGDVVTCPPNVHHWHGASPTVSMTHLTITGEVDGKNTEWLEPVTDEQYQAHK
jgi:quercetin dioxygenase-like cupin family protein